MPGVRAYPATGTDGSGEQGSASPSRRRGRRRGVEIRPGSVKQARLVAVGDNAAAATAADALIAKTSNPTKAAHARVLAATALIRLGQPVRARTQASAARAHFEQAGDVLMTAESLSWEAAGAMQMQDPAA